MSKSLRSFHHLPSFPGSPAHPLALPASSLHFHYLLQTVNSYEHHCAVWWFPALTSSMPQVSLCLRRLFISFNIFFVVSTWIWKQKKRLCLLPKEAAQWRWHMRICSQNTENEWPLVVWRMNYTEEEELPACDTLTEPVHLLTTEKYRLSL